MNKRDTNGKFIKIYNDDIRLLEIKTPFCLLKNRKISEKDIEQMKQMRQENHSYRYIASVFKVSHQTVMQHINTSYRERRLLQLKTRIKKSENVLSKKNRDKERRERLLNSFFSETTRAKERIKSAQKRIKSID